MKLANIINFNDKKINKIRISEEKYFVNLKFNNYISTFNKMDLDTLYVSYLDNSQKHNDFYLAVNLCKDTNKKISVIINKFNLYCAEEDNLIVIKEIVDFKNSFFSREELINTFEFRFNELKQQIDNYKKNIELVVNVNSEINSFNLFVPPLKKIFFEKENFDITIKEDENNLNILEECSKIQKYMELFEFLHDFIDKKYFLPCDDEFMELKDYWLVKYNDLEYDNFDISLYEKFISDTLIFAEMKNIHGAICKYQSDIKDGINQLFARITVNKILESLFNIQVNKLEENYKKISKNYNFQQENFNVIIDNYIELKDRIFDFDKDYASLISPIKNTTNMLGITNDDDIKDICDYYIYSLSKNIERKMHSYGSSKNITSDEIENIINIVEDKLYVLTSDQRNAVMQSINYLNENYTANCLIQGDVSSGKTIVTVIMMFILGLKKKKSVYIIPRKVLRMQHLNTLRKYNKLFNLNLKIFDSSEEFDIKDADIVLHGYSFNDNRFSEVTFDLGVIDEIQLFGVEQRNLVQRKYPNIDMFYTTATPHPRTKLISLIGNLDIIEIKEMPLGRKLKNTETFTFFGDCQIQRINEEASKGNVILVVCPLVNKKGFTEFESLPTAFLKYKELFPNLRVEQLRADYSSDKQEMIIEKVLNGDIDILIATKSIEVGIDIPRASVIVIHYPYVMKIKWGVSQLHQLRGRIGRNNQDSYCYIETPSNYNEKSPIGSVLKSQDVFELTKNDFDWRGFEKIIGTKQSGNSGSKSSQEKRIKAYEIIAKSTPNILEKLEDSFIERIENALKECRIENLN